MKTRTFEVSGSDCDGKFRTLVSCRLFPQDYRDKEALKVHLKKFLDESATIEEVTEL